MLWTHLLCSKFNTLKSLDGNVETQKDGGGLMYRWTHEQSWSIKWMDRWMDGWTRPFYTPIPTPLVSNKNCESHFHLAIKIFYVMIVKINGFTVLVKNKSEAIIHPSSIETSSFIASKLFKSWWHHEMETFSALLALYAGNSTVSGEFPSQRPVMQSFHVFFDLHLE